MKCAVSTCNSYSKKGSSIRFYCFPKDDELRAKWISFCDRPYNFKYCEARVCSLHFKTDDFERNLQFEMGYCKRNGYKIKPNVVPTITQIETIDDNLGATDDATNEYENDDNHIERHPDMNFEEVTIPPHHHEIIQNLERDINQLKKDNKLLQQAQRETSKEINLLKEHTKKLATESCNLENKLLKIFSASQIKKIKGGDRRIIWTDEDVEQSMQLYSISSKAYKHLLEKGFPLPSVRTLQNWFHKIRVNPEVDDNAVEIIKENDAGADTMQPHEIGANEVIIYDDVNMDQEAIWEELIEEEEEGVEEEAQVYNIGKEAEVLEGILWS